MVDEVSRIGSPLEALRLRFFEYCATLLEGQVRSHHFAAATRDLTRSEHQEILADLRRFEREQAGKPLAVSLEDVARRCDSLQGALDLLADERQRRLHRNGDYVKEIMREFDRMTSDLSTTLIEKSLLERQSRVLESIILSYEKVSQWKTFVQQILADFHTVFPFDFFIVAFSEEHSLGLYIYFMGAYADDVRAVVRERFAADFLRQLKLPPSTPVDVEEFIVLKAPAAMALADVSLLTVAMPEHLPGLSGILGVGYASSSPLTAQEAGIIRSILSVMMMVVGSSKVLNRTLLELEYYSTHDPLTGLHNRRHFNQMLEYEVGRSERHHHNFSLLFLDLDDFKDINDSYGHPTGDEVLRSIGEAITLNLRKGDLACRIGGDEFAVLLPETGLEGGMSAGEHLRELIAKREFPGPNGKSFHTSVSIGVVSYPRDAQTFGELVATVDVSLYHAKHLGKNITANIDSAKTLLQETRAKRTDVEMLREAFKADRVVPYFQPIVHCQSGELFAYESVARLIAENGEIATAATFIDAVEKYGLVHDLDRIMIEKSLREKKRSLQDGARSVRLFVNLSAQEIQGRGILGYAEDLCERLEMPPSCLVFEIVERDAIGDMSNMRKFLSNLRKQGFAFALDDFGSGYNSFHYLRELRFEYVKLDGSSVRNILNSQIDHALVCNLVRLCNDLGIETIAECVETEGILNALRQIGTNYVQGYHIDMPQPHMK